MARFCPLNIQNPIEIKRITTNAENDATSGIIMFFFLLHGSVIQRSGLSSTLKIDEGAKILGGRKLNYQC